MARRLRRFEEPQVRDLDDADETTPETSPDVRQQSDESDSSELNRVERLLARIRSTPAGRLGLKVTVTVTGAVIIAVGIVLLPLPGPGWLIIFTGLAVWSLEFHWARRLNRFVRRQVGRWTLWYARQGWPTRIVVGLLTGLFVLAVIALSLRISLGSHFLDRIRSVV